MEEIEIKSLNGSSGNGEVKCFYPSDDQICIQVSETSSMFGTGWSAVQFLTKEQAKDLGKWLIKQAE